jgi:transketolase
MPCVERFLQQDISYQHSILPVDITKRIAIEAGATIGWYKFVGLNGKVIGIDRYGESAPYQEIYDFLKINVENILEVAQSL